MSGLWPGNSSPQRAGRASLIKLEPRAEPSRWLAIASPVLALAITVSLGVLLFLLLDKDPLSCLQMFFVEPVKNGRAIAELSIKATPLLLIGLGLSVCFRSNVWNIGAEGQFILGSIFATWVALRATPESGIGLMIALLAAGALGGALWASVTCVLRDRFNASEILVSLMLVYVAEQLLSYLVNGPWKDPNGYNFPQTITFLASARIPRLVEGSRANIGLLLALASAAACFVFMHKSFAGYRLDVAGLSPAAARYAASRRARRFGYRSCSRAAWPAWPARWRWPAQMASSRPTFHWATGLRPSSWPSSVGSTRSA